MNKEKQKIAIAEACGVVSKDKWGTLYKTPRGVMRDCPDYLVDLNAMHEAEKVFEGYGMRQSYRRNLLIACDTNDLNEIISASASQRAEAFLRTIGKWEEL